MTVEARGGGWRARVRRRGHDLQATFDTKEDAVAWEAGTVAAIVAGRPLGTSSPAGEEVPPAPLALREACREWGRLAEAGVVRSRSGKRYREGTLHTTRYRLRLHVLPYLGRLPVASITPGVIRGWLEDLESDTTASTARMGLDSLRPIMRRLAELEVIPTNPCNGIRPPVVEDEDLRPVRFLEPEEGARLRAAAYADKHDRIGAFVDLGLATGARRGELLALTWGPGGLDLTAGTVTITGSFSLRTGKVGPTKSGKPRTVPLGPEVIARMREYRMSIGRPEDGERVFPFDPRAMFRRVATAAKLNDPQPTIHSMRHTAATWWLSAGLTVHAVADLLGHRDPTLVIKLYGHVLKREQDTAGEQLERFLREAGTAS